VYIIAMPGTGCETPAGLPARFFPGGGCPRSPSINKFQHERLGDISSAGILLKHGEIAVRIEEKFTKT